MQEQLVAAWRANCTINALLIDSISDAGMQCTLSKRGGRGVAGEFAHMHNIRLAHVQRRAKSLAHNLVKFETKVHPTKMQLRKPAFVCLPAANQRMSSFRGSFRRWHRGLLVPHERMPRSHQRQTRSRISLKIPHERIPRPRVRMPAPHEQRRRSHRRAKNSHLCGNEANTWQFLPMKSCLIPAQDDQRINF